MKVCIVGVGAIGGFIGTKLACTGEARVAALTRGATLAALRTHGWRVQHAGVQLRAPAIADDNAQALGAQDLVIIAVKGPALAAVAQSIQPLLHQNTIVMPAMNGVPWWFGEGIAALNGQALQSIDPNGAIAAAIPFPRVLGCVVHGSMAAPEPGLVVHKMGQGLIIGEPRGGSSSRVVEVSALLRNAGFDVTESENIRYDIWYKLWGNLTMNPISAITGATIDRVLADPLLRQFCSDAMVEANTIGTHIGCGVAQSAEDRHAITAKLGAFKTSMLQDVEANRAIELDSIVTAVQELGAKLNIATPNVNALLGMARVFAQTRGLYPSRRI